MVREAVMGPRGSTVLFLVVLWSGCSAVKTPPPISFGHLLPPPPPVTVGNFSTDPQDNATMFLLRQIWCVTDQKREGDSQSTNLFKGVPRRCRRCRRFSDKHPPVTVSQLIPARARSLESSSPRAARTIPIEPLGSPTAASRCPSLHGLLGTTHVRGGARPTPSRATLRAT